MRILICCICLLLLQDLKAQSPTDLRSKLQKFAADTDRVAQLTELGRFYLLKPGEIKTDLDSAQLYLDQAKELSIKINRPDLQYNCISIIGNVYVECGELEKGGALLLEVIHYYQQTKNIKQEADTWHLLGNLYYNNGKDDHKSQRFKYHSTANKLYKQINDRGGYLETLLEMALYQVEFGEQLIGEKQFDYVVAEYLKDGRKEEAAQIWVSLSGFLSSTGRSLPAYLAYCNLNAYKLLMQCKKPVEAAGALNKAAELQVYLGQYNSAETNYLRLLELYKKNHIKKLHEVYYWLANIYDCKKQPEKELDCRLKCLQFLNRDDPDKGMYYAAASNTYSLWGMAKKSDQMMAKALTDAISHSDQGSYLFYLQGITDDMINNHQAVQALAFVNKRLAKIKAANIDQQTNIADMYGSCYVALHQYKKAEPYIERMKDLFYVTEIKKNKLNYDNLSYYLNKIIRFYVLDKQFNKALFYLKKVDDLPAIVIPTIYRSSFELHHYKIDSTAGHYLSAINHFRHYKALADSVFSTEKIAKINELEIKYEAGQKDRSITMLKNKGLAQDAKVQKANYQRNVTLGGITMLFIAGGFFFNSYRHKQRSNRDLQVKQTEINFQNQVLQNTLSEKDDLIIEKEWLLKEVHHRVKNNLQIVMSLLNTQSAYLKNNAAVAAIKESQSRVQAISLIHQKLYSSNSITTIYMPAYIADLVKYLRESFNVEHCNVVFENIVEPIKLDQTQAVPLGLILNEAITNAIKYAFERKGGQVVVALGEKSADIITLTITDNGKGLPKGFDLKKANSLGMEMMKALSRQLGGTFEIKNNPGVQITVKFQVEHVHYNSRDLRKATGY